MKHLHVFNSQPTNRLATNVPPTEAAAPATFPKNDLNLSQENQLLAGLFIFSCGPGSPTTRIVRFRVKR